MFEEFFHLRENPFALAPNPRFIFRSHEHTEALAHLRFWIENGEGFVLITGEVGTGKTTALFDLMGQLPNEWAVAFVSNSTLTGAELLEEICRRFQVVIPRVSSKPALLERLERHLVDRGDKGLGSVLILDEAQNYENRLLEEVRLLSNLERADGKLLQIALVGQPELERKLEQPDLRQLRQRIGIRYRLNPLSEEETIHYVHHRLAVAGGDAEQIFPRESGVEVHRLTHGIPREINVVASQALISAFVQGSAHVSPEQVRSVVLDFAWSSILGRGPLPPVARTPGPPRGVAGGTAREPGPASEPAAGVPATPPGEPPAPASGPRQRPPLGVVRGGVPPGVEEGPPPDEAPRAEPPPIHPPVRPGSAEPRAPAGARAAPVPARSGRASGLRAGRAGTRGRDRDRDQLRSAGPMQNRVPAAGGQASTAWIESLTEAPSGRRFGVIGTWAIVGAVLVAGALLLWSQRAMLPFGPPSKSEERPAGAPNPGDGRIPGPASPPAVPAPDSAPPESVKTMALPAGAAPGEGKPAATTQVVTKPKGEEIKARPGTEGNTPAKADTGTNRVGQTTLVPRTQSTREPGAASTSPARAGTKPSDQPPARTQPEAPARETPAPETPAPEGRPRVVPGPYGATDGEAAGYL